ncbi:hypothetical protein OXPF_31420 [Oxobacter pfennigii]|uniref:Phosphodiester glycosidase domain-containing protein n=1 Tax=Oxobacter pfennigii TaxID=36849 RepID=A0A0P8Y9V6_9CLOT|nr:phosphodiester glycosidase family protein [Oxobacter pfennigii]KPU43700.1 hypothetical protein OXPF_31420 [Oxobacter pfennigii]
MKRKSDKKFTKKVICFTATTVLISNCVLGSVTSYALGGFNLKSKIVDKAINEYRVDIAPGVTESRYSFIGNDGKKREVFVTNIDMENNSVSIEAGTPYDGDSIGLQTVRGQADAATSYNHTVVAAVNGDFFNMSTGEPFGIIYKDGRAVRPNYYSTWRFFGITKDNKAVIGDMSYYSQIGVTLKEAIGGQAIIVKDGKSCEPAVYDTGINPRTAVGIKENGDVFFVAVDGRQEPYSAGLTSKDFTQLMIDLGAVTALELDGGGSTTYLSRIPGEDILGLINKPSAGAERKVANSWLVVSTAESDHKFANAYIEPYDSSYTPGSTVEFSFKGRDSSLASAPIETSGLKWSLSSTRYGKINNKGVFVSNGKTGEVEVILKYNNKVAGSTWIEIANPDTLEFDMEPFTVIPNMEKQLTMKGSVDGRPLVIKASDIEWELPKTLGTVDKDGVFHAAKNPEPGKITAKYKKNKVTAEIELELGKKPEVLYAFENGLGVWGTSVAGKGENSSISLSSSEKDLVRFDEKALKIDFDFTNALWVDTLGVYAGPGTASQIQGNISSIGMWVYGTPEAQGYWLRSAIIDGKGNIQNLDLTDGATGINWIGWKYVEAKIPSSIAKPVSLHPTQAIRIMSVNSGIKGPMTKGSIYVDNIRAVFEITAEDDLFAPIIEEINVDGKSYNTRSVSINAKVRDNEEDPYMSDINWDKVTIIVDDVDYSKKKNYLTFNKKNGTVTLKKINWTKGVHEVTVVAWDNFGNEATRTVEFTIK